MLGFALVGTVAGSLQIHHTSHMCTPHTHTNTYTPLTHTINTTHIPHTHTHTHTHMHTHTIPLRTAFSVSQYRPDLSPQALDICWLTLPMGSHCSPRMSSLVPSPSPHLVPRAHSPTLLFIIRQIQHQSWLLLFGISRRC